MDFQTIIEITKFIVPFALLMAISLSAINNYHYKRYQFIYEKAYQKMINSLEHHKVDDFEEIEIEPEENNLIFMT